MVDRAEVNAIPEHWLGHVNAFLMGQSNGTVDLRKPHMRHSMVNIYPFFIFIYAALIVTGFVSNVGVIYYIAKNKLTSDPTFSFLVNIALGDIVKCVFVLPITLMVLLLQNWIFDQFLCFFLPMLQDVPIHVSTLSFLLIALDRFRLMRDPMKPRVPGFVCAVGAWLLAVCIVLPYPIYTTYLDLGFYIKQLHGVGICIINLAEDIQEYMRGLFVIMYAAPLGCIAYLYVRVSTELDTQEGPLALVMFEARRERSSADTTHFQRGSRGEYDRDSQYSRGSYRSSGCVRNRYDLYEAELDICREKRTQKYMISMVTIFAICLCPLMVLRLAQLAVTETYENSGHFDITYTMFVWIAFLPTCSTPALFTSWQMSRPTKERLRGYFRFSNRKLHQSSCDAVITAGESAGDIRRQQRRAGSDSTNGKNSRNGKDVALSEISASTYDPEFVAS